MLVPGGNLLNIALSVIAKQPFQYRKFAGRSTNEIGLDVAAYNQPIALSGSVQPVPRTLYQAYGLDFQCNYINVCVSRAVLDIARDVAGDQIIFQGNTYQCISKTPWAGIDGWDAVLAVQVQSV